MATTPVIISVPVPAPTPPVNKVSAFLKAHELVIILILCLVAGWFVYSRAVKAWDAHDQRNADIAHAALAANVTTANQLAAVSAQNAADYKALATQLVARNTALSTSQGTRTTATQTQQVTDRKLPPNELANRWTAILKLPPES